MNEEQLAAIRAAALDWDAPREHRRRLGQLLKHIEAQDVEIAQLWFVTRLMNVYQDRMISEIKQLKKLLLGKSGREVE